MKKLFFLMLSAVLFTACNSDDDVIIKPKGKYDNGIFVLNEGNFTRKLAEVSFIGADGTIENNIFTNNNEGKILGDVLQGMCLYKDKAYLVINNSNKVVVVDRYTFKEIAEITQEIHLPRYATVANGKLFVTNSSTSDVTIYDAETFEFLGKIKLSGKPERVLSRKNDVYVMQSFFGSGNTVMILDAETQMKKDSVLLEKGLNAIAMDASKENLYALCSPQGKEPHVFQISTKNNKVAKEWVANSTGYAGKMAVDNNQVYFVKGADVYHINPNKIEIDDTPILSFQNTDWSSFYGFNVIDNRIYIGNAKGFVNPSEVGVYNLQGQLIATHIATSGVNGFLKN